MTNMKCSNTAMLLGYFKKQNIYFPACNGGVKKPITESQRRKDLKQIVKERTDQIAQLLATYLRPDHNKLFSNQKLREQAS